MVTDAVVIASLVVDGTCVVTTTDVVTGCVVEDETVVVAKMHKDTHNAAIRMQSVIKSVYR